MKYPNNIKKEYKKEINYKNRGMDLEALINDACLYYLEHDLAVIYKKPTPIGVVDVDYKNGAVIHKAYFKEPSTLDYNGIYKLNLMLRNVNLKQVFLLVIFTFTKLNILKKY